MAGNREALDGKGVALKGDENELKVQREVLKNYGRHLMAIERRYSVTRWQSGDKGRRGGLQLR